MLMKAETLGVKRRTRPSAYDAFMGRRPGESGHFWYIFEHYGTPMATRKTFDRRPEKGSRRT